MERDGVLKRLREEHGVAHRVPRWLGEGVWIWGDVLGVGTGLANGDQEGKEGERVRSEVGGREREGEQEVDKKQEEADRRFVDLILGFMSP